MFGAALSITMIDAERRTERWAGFVRVLISTEMIKMMQWKFPQVGGSIPASVITGRAPVRAEQCNIPTQTRAVLAGSH